VVRGIMVFLHSHGVGTVRAVRIFKTYGNDAAQVMAENPYRLAALVGQSKVLAMADMNHDQALTVLGAYAQRFLNHVLATILQITRISMDLVL
jgi:hypothetical protein